MKKELTVELLAATLFEELENYNWGDVDPFLFTMVAEGLDPDDDNYLDALCLKQVLDAVVARLK